VGSKVRKEVPLELVLDGKRCGVFSWKTRALQAREDHEQDAVGTVQ
jgi:hypothetical protein